MLSVQGEMLKTDECAEVVKASNSDRPMRQFKNTCVRCLKRDFVMFGLFAGKQLPFLLFIKVLRSRVNFILSPENWRYI